MYASCITHTEVLLPPHRLTRQVEEDRHVFAPDGAEGGRPPALGAGQRGGQLVLAEPAHLSCLERVALQATPDGPAVEDERVQRHAGEPESETVEHGDEADRHGVDAGLL